MNNNIDNFLKQKMSIDEIQSVPKLHKNTLKLISSRKKELPERTSFFDLIFNRFKAVSVGFAIVAIIIAIDFVCTLNIEKHSGKTANNNEDTTLTVSSNTYLATLNQFTAAAELPANTTTALTSISTFATRN